MIFQLRCCLGQVRGYTHLYLVHVLSTNSCQEGEEKSANQRLRLEGEEKSANQRLRLEAEIRNRLWPGGTLLVGLTTAAASLPLTTADRER